MDFSQATGGTLTLTNGAGAPSEVLLNGYHFMDPTTDVVRAGTTETWQWINLTVDWEAYLASGRGTVKSPPGYVTRTRATFTLPSTSLLDYDAKTRSFGHWVYHCHILEHEENDMMRPFRTVW